jgi:ABC-type bacteriocin/lantibiotic exporter with double-glycine peptidase domain
MVSEGDAMSSLTTTSNARKAGSPALTMAKLVWEHKWQAGIIATVGLVLGALGWSTAFYIQIVLDRGRNARLVYLLGGAALLIAVIRGLLAVVRRALQLTLVRSIERKAAGRYLDHVLSLRLEHFDRHAGGELYERLHGLEDVRHALEDRFLGASFDAVIVVVAGAFLIRYSGVLAALAALGALIPAVIVTFIRDSIKQSYNETQERNARVTQTCMDAFSGLRDLRVIGGEEWMLERLMRHYSEAQDRRKRHLVRLALIGNGTSLLSGLLSITILVLGARYLRVGLLSAGELMFVFTMAGSMLGPLENFIVSWIFFQDAMVALGRAEDILALPAEPRMDDSRDISVQGCLKLEEVTFSYEGKREAALREIHLEIPSGSSLAIVGESGAGKTTLLALLAGLYRPTSGRVLVDGRDLKDIPPRQFRKHLGAVFEKPHLFGVTLEENLRTGFPGAGSDEIRRALRSACLEEFVDSLPLGFATPLGEGGTRLSAGQAQRIAIARALVRNPRILLLDEATSNLDAHTEAALREALRAQSRGRTTVFVTHRLASSMEADRIIVLEKGVIVERGGFWDLMKARGAYHRLWSRQVPVALPIFGGEFAGASGSTDFPDAPAS